MKSRTFRQVVSVSLLFLAAWLVVGCEPVRHYNRLQVANFSGPTKPTRKPYGTVKIFQTAKEIKHPYEVIGMMSCEGSAAEEAGIINAMLYRAADLGADGVLLNTATAGAEDVTGSRINIQYGAPMLGNGNQRAYRAQAIRFKD